MNTKSSILVSDYLPILGRVLASIVTRFRAGTDKLESEIAYYGCQDDFSDNVILCSERWVEDPVAVNEEFLHQTAALWIEDRILQRLGAQAVEGGNAALAIIKPALREVEDPDLVKLWLSGTATNGLRFLAAAKNAGPIYSRMRKILIMPQIEVIPSNPRGPGDS